MAGLHTGWTEAHGVSQEDEGLDHLSLASVSESIYDRVTPGFTTLTNRARYYALYCWILYDYFNSGYETEEFESFFRRREHAYALACVSHAHKLGTPGGAAIVGARSSGRRWRVGEDPLDLAKSHIKTRFGGYGNYQNAMQRAGLLKLSEGWGSLTESSTGAPSGRAVAEAFQSVVEDTTYFRRYRDEYHVPRAVIEEYGQAACLCEVSGAPDGEVLRRAFLQPNPPESDVAARGVHISRSRTLALVFDALSKCGGERIDDMAWRELLFYGSFSDGRPYATPEGLGDAVLVWRMYQQRELHVYALTSIWAELLYWLEDRGPATLEEWVEELDSAVDLLRTGRRFGLHPKRGRPSEITVGELLDSIAAAAGVGSTFEPHLTQRISESIKRGAPGSEKALHGALVREELPEPGDYVAAALWLSLMLYARTRHWSSEGPAAADLARTGDSRHWSIESFFGEIARRREGSALELLAWISRNLVRQHLTVAMSKLPRDTFRLLYEDGLLHYRRSDQPQFRGYRYEKILTISRDLGWIEETSGVYRLTALGERSRSDALAALQ